MRFLNRANELGRLDELIESAGGRFGVVYGRRRIGKTRLLIEWTRRHGGLYTVADQSAPNLQRRYLADALSKALPGFGDVDYPSWASLLERLARDARRLKWKGPLVLDELPYLAQAAPELASVLQRFVDHELPGVGLKLAIAGSSQRMMQGLVLAGSAPLYGRAHALFELAPLDVSELPNAFGRRSVHEVIGLHAAWGGIPRYWELAAEAGHPVARQVEALVLDPLGPLHTEPDRLLMEESPPAIELRPILDAIGQGAHRLSEIASRIGARATSLSRPLKRLQELGLIRREVPFGEPERSGKRSLYKLDDPFMHLWFRVVAPNRARLATDGRKERLKLLRSRWPELASAAFEELCRRQLPSLNRRTKLGRIGPWRPGSRWWHGNAPEWDLIAESEDGEHVLVGEVKWSATAFASKKLEHLAHEVARRPLPPTIPGSSNVVRAVFVPETSRSAPRPIQGVHIVPSSHLLPG